MRHPISTGNVFFTSSEDLSHKNVDYALRNLVTTRQCRDRNISPQRLNEIVREVGDPSVAYGREYKKNQHMDMEDFLNGNKYKIFAYYMLYNVFL